MHRRNFLLALSALGLSWAPKPKPLKLAFSTLGCPDWSWQTVLQKAVALGYQGIELRGLGPELDLLKTEVFSPSNLPASLRQLNDNGLKIINLGSSANLHFHEAGKRREQLDQAKRYIDLAEKLHCPFVRVFPNNLPSEFAKAATLEKIATALVELGKHAQGSKVKVLLETHGDVVKTDDLLTIMQAAESKHIGLIWDFFNMYIITRQSPTAMFAALKKYIHHVHLKDGILQADGSFKYVFMGAGNVPLAEVVAVLKENRYHGYYSFEWEKRWHPEIASPELAFPDFVKYMKQA
jgi:sugar phosphate isomerase/epimerase